MPQYNSTHADYYIAPDGDDAWSGTLLTPNATATDGPFASLSRARDAVRELKESNSQRDITVLIRDGTYRLTETVVFNLQDAADDGCTITYAAYPSERPVFSSGVPVAGWHRLTETPQGLSESAHGHVWVADAPQVNGKTWRFFTLYDGETRLPRARSAGFQLCDPPDLPPERTKDTLYYPQGALKEWPNLQDVEILVRPAHAWTMNILGLSSVDEAACTARTTLPASYPLTRPGHFIDTIRESCWVENVLDVLDTPGEWVLDTVQGQVYLWPKGDTPGDQIVAPCLRELIRVEGEISLDGPTDQPVRGLVFRGLTLTQGDRDLWTDDDAGVQHDWEMHDQDNALLRLRGAEDCLVEACRFANSGGTAIRLDLHCQRNRVVGNLIEHVGGTGILLCGYGAGTKDVNKNNEVVNNHIHHCGEIYWHSMAIVVWQSGNNRVANNLIHHTNYDAIVLSGLRPFLFVERDNLRESGTIRRHEAGSVAKWQKLLDGITFDRAETFIPYLEQVRPFLHTRDNVVEDNEIHHGMAFLGDGNAIYLSDVGTGNVIRRNYIHHFLGKGGQSAIRTDAFMTGTVVAENIIYKCACGGLNIKYYDNHAENNIVVDVPDIVDTDVDGNPVQLSFGYVSLSGVFAQDTIPPGTETRVQRNILYKTDATRPFYREMTRDGQPVEAGVADCDIDHNLYFAPDEADAGQSHLDRYRSLGLDPHSLVADPLFVDVKKGDLRLQPNSPAFALGFEPIDVDLIGLRTDLPCFENLTSQFEEERQ